MGTWDADSSEDGVPIELIRGMEEKKRKKQISHRLKTRSKNAMEALFKIKNDAVELIISKIQGFSF